MRKTLSGLLVGAGAAALLTVAGAPVALAAAPPAAAQPADHVGTFAVPAGSGGVTVRVDGASVTVVRPAHVSPDDLTTCTVSVNKPALAAGGNVSGSTIITCNGEAASINVVAALYLGGSLIASNNTTKVNAYGAAVSVQAAYQSGSWKTGGLCTYFGYDGGGTATDEKYSAAVNL